LVTFQSSLLKEERDDFNSSKNLALLGEKGEKKGRERKRRNLFASAYIFYRDRRNPMERKKREKGQRGRFYIFRRSLAYIRERRKRKKKGEGRRDPLNAILLNCSAPFPERRRK